MGLTRKRRYLPGVILDDTELNVADHGPRYIGSDRIRFVHDQPQKIGGWEKWSSVAFVGTCRSMRAWLTAAGVPLLALGTNEKLTAIQNTNFLSASSGGYGGDEGTNDITPLRLDDESLTNPFTVGAESGGYVDVTVDHTTHGAMAGDWVTYSSATPLSGITVDGEYKIQSIVNNDSYVIRHKIGNRSFQIPSANMELVGRQVMPDTGASNVVIYPPKADLSLSSGLSQFNTSALNGGGTVNADYQINVGNQDTAFGYGYGVGTYGSGTYGTPRSTFLVSPARTWFLDNFGQNLLAMPLGGNLYKWTLTFGVRAAIVPGAPTGNKGFFVTEEEHIVVLGAGGQPMRVEWSDQSDDTVWTPDSTNTAGGRTLGGGSQLVGGLKTRNTNLIWTDSSVWTMTFIGGLDVFGFKQEASGSAGLISPHAAIDVDGIVYWMGNGDFFYFDGAVRRIPNSKDIRQTVFSGLDQYNSVKVNCVHISQFSEIWWFYPTDTEITHYVKFNYSNRAWDHGTVARTAAISDGVFDKPLMTAPNNYIYKHETGFDDDGAPMNEYIKASPFDIDQQGRWTEIFGVIPDVKNLAGPIELTLYTRDYPQGSEFTESVHVIVPGTTDIDAHASGRQVAWKIGSSVLGTNWRFGTIRFDVTPGGER